MIHVSFASSFDNRIGIDLIVGGKEGRSLVEVKRDLKGG